MLTEKLIITHEHVCPACNTVVSCDHAASHLPCPGCGYGEFVDRYDIANPEAIKQDDCIPFAKELLSMMPDEGLPILIALMAPTIAALVFRGSVTHQKILAQILGYVEAVTNLMLAREKLRAENAGVKSQFIITTPKNAMEDIAAALTALKCIKPGAPGSTESKLEHGEGLKEALDAIQRAAKKHNPEG